MSKSGAPASREKNRIKEATKPYRKMLTKGDPVGLLCLSNAMEALETDDIALGKAFMAIYHRETHLWSGHAIRTKKAATKARREREVAAA